jgi:hypothetical protein
VCRKGTPPKFAVGIDVIISQDHTVCGALYLVPSLYSLHKNATCRNAKEWAVKRSGQEDSLALSATSVLFCTIESESLMIPFSFSGRLREEVPLVATKFTDLCQSHFSISGILHPSKTLGN